MSNRRSVTRNAIELIKRFEGYRRNAAQAPDGRWTIGYGHTQTARQGASVSEADAEALLMYDLIAVAHEVNERVYAPLNRNQFDALCAFAFNIGVENFRHSSVLRRINEGSMLQAALAMELWRKAEFDGDRITVDALVRRRAAEKTLFLTPPDGVWTPAPSPVVRPQIDHDGDGLVPQQKPQVVTTATQGDRIHVIRRPDGENGGMSYTPAEEGPSPLQKAAGSVTSRLQALFRTPERRVSAAAPVLELTPPEPAEQPRAAQAAAEQAELDLVAANEGAADLFTEPYASANDPAGEVTAAADAEPALTPVRPKPARQEPTVMLLVTLGACGLILFFGGLYWFFNASGGPAAGAFSNVVAGIATFGGVACFSVAAYQLLERLGRMAGDLGED